MDFPPLQRHLKSQEPAKNLSPKMINSKLIAPTRVVNEADLFALVD